MKNFAVLLSAAVLSASSLAANAAPIDVFGSGVSVLLNGSVIDTANVNLLQNGFSVQDHGSLLTVTYVTTPTIGIVPGTGLLNVTEICATAGISLGGSNTGTPCAAQALSFTDANFGAVQIDAALALGAQESVMVSGNTATVQIAQAASIGLDSASFTFVDPVSGVSGTPASNPVPEPGTFGMMATGILGAAGAIRRKFMA